MSSIGGIVARLGELTLPIQVMQGSADALIPPQALRDVVGGVSSEDLVARLWPGLYHEIFNEPVGATVIDALISWILDRTA
jgi:alpha-beta hydrolase superfamily lysophospholipase